MKTGFNNWRKALEKFSKHEASKSHSEAVLKMQCVTNVNIGDIMVATCKQQQLFRQRMLVKQFASLRYLVRQGLAIRGHEENEGYLSQLLRLRSADNPDMLQWLKDGKYLSPDILNEMIKLMADNVLRELLVEIRSARFYAVQADETTDASSNEQMCVAIRWTDKEYSIFEDPIGLLHVPKTDADTLTLMLKDTLIRCNLPLTLCRGQAYDGAANMSGRIRGVATQIKSVEPKALHVHCLAHCLNLCLQDAARICVIV